MEHQSRREDPNFLSARFNSDHQHVGHGTVFYFWNSNHTGERTRTPCKPGSIRIEGGAKTKIMGGMVWKIQSSMTEPLYPLWLNTIVINDGTWCQVKSEYETIGDLILSKWAHCQNKSGFTSGADAEGDRVHYKPQNPTIFFNYSVYILHMVLQKI